MKKLYILLGHNNQTSEVLNVFQNEDDALEQQTCHYDNFERTELIIKEVNDIKHNTVYIVLGLDQSTGFVLQVDTSEKEIKKNLYNFEKEYLVLYIIKKEVI